MAREVKCRVQIDWDFDGNFAEHDESANVISVSGDFSFAPPEDNMLSSSSGIVDRCTIELRNVGNRYSPFNTSSPLYSLIQNGKSYHVPVIVDMAIDGTTYQRMFTGVTKIPKETSRNVSEPGSVKFECRSRDELFLQKRMSTTQSGFVSRFIDGWNEGQIIVAFLNAAGATPHNIEQGMITIPWSWIDNESVLEDIWNLAAACGGRFYVDRNGVFTYENMAHWLREPHTTSQQTYGSNSWKTFSMEFDENNIYNSITVEFASRYPDTSQVVWTPDEEIEVPANSTKKVTATYSQPIFTVPQIEYKAHSSGGVDLTGSVSISATHYAQRSVLNITNTHYKLAAALSSFEITSSPVVGAPEEEEQRTSTDHGTNQAFFTNRGDRDKSIRANPYVQSRAQAGMISQFLLDRLETPRVRYKLQGMLGETTRIPGDRITIYDQYTMSSARQAIIVGISWQFSNQSYTMDLDCIDAASLYKYLGTTPGYFVVGTNKLGASDPLRGRLFY